MHIAGASKVQDKDGVWGTVVSGSPPLPSNAAQVVVQTESGQQFLVPTDAVGPATGWELCPASASGRA